MKTSFKHFFYALIFGLALHGPALRAQSLDQMENVAIEAGSLQNFLSSAPLQKKYLGAVARYQGALGADGGIDPSFCDYFQDRIKNLRDYFVSYPYFARALWNIRSEAEAGRDFEVESNFKTSGYQFNETKYWQNYYLQWIYEIRAELKDTPFDIPLGNGIDAMSPELVLLSERLEVANKMAAELELELPRISALPYSERVQWRISDPRVRALYAFFVEYLTEREAIGDAFASKDGDRIYAVMRELDSPAKLVRQHLSSNVKITPQLLSMINRPEGHELATAQKFYRQMKLAQETEQEFLHVPSGGNDPVAIQKANALKWKIVKNHQADLFTLQPLTQPHNGKLILAPKGGTTQFRAVRRPLHAVFRCYKHGECVMNDVNKWLQQVWPNRRIYFSERSGHMTGYLQVVEAQQGHLTVAALEVMSPSVSGEVVQMRDGQIQRMATFDAIVEQLYAQKKPGWLGYLISNNDRANNAGGKASVYASQSYRLGQALFHHDSTIGPLLALPAREAISDGIQIEQKSHVGYGQLLREPGLSPAELLEKLFQPTVLTSRFALRDMAIPPELIDAAFTAQSLKLFELYPRIEDQLFEALSDSVLPNLGRQHLRQTLMDLARNPHSPLTPLLFRLATKGLARNTTSKDANILLGVLIQHQTEFRKRWLDKKFYDAFFARYAGYADHMVPSLTQMLEVDGHNPYLLAHVQDFVAKLRMTDDFRKPLRSVLLKLLSDHPDHPLFERVEFAFIENGLKAFVVRSDCESALRKPEELD